MGEIAVDFELENPIDRGIFERGLGEQSSVRRTRVQGIVDTTNRTLTRRTPDYPVLNLM